MKASIVFREERSPLLRAKLPFTLGSIPVSSGILLGNAQDLAFHLGTFFSRGPSFRLAFKPNEPGSPVSLIMKTGLGVWGSPNHAPLALTAEFQFAAKDRDPILSLRVKPRLGDFSVRKDVDLLQTALNKAPAPGELKEDDKQHRVSSSHGPNASPQKLGNGLISGSLPNGDGKGFNIGSPGSPDKDMVRSLSTDTGHKVIGSNFSFKIEGLDREWKGRGEWKQKMGKGEGDPDGMGGSGAIAEVPNETCPEETKGEWRKSAATLSSTVGNGIRGSKIIAHSSLPLGGRAMLNIRWGVKPAPELFTGWDGSLPSMSFSKLPFLLLDKVRVESVVPPAKLKEDVSRADRSGGYLESAMLPVSFVEENRELAQVATMCYSMKRQLHLLYAENKVLRKAMEEMNTQFEYRGSVGQWKPFASSGDILIEEQTVPTRSALLDAPKDGSSREDGRQCAEVKKDRREDSRKDGHTDITVSNADKSAPSRESSDVSEELRKAIMHSKNSSTEGKNG